MTKTKSISRTSVSGDEVRVSRISSGVTILSETMPGQRGAAIGVWVGLGSRHDPRGKAGLAHLFEHMVFKGTAKRSPLRISKELEEVGGSLNAWTSREHTCFYAKVLEKDVPRAVSLLCDLVTGARITERDLNKERLVVLEEVRSCDDDPDELVGDLFAEGLWAAQPLGAPISGTLDSVAGLTRDDLLMHQARALSAEVPVCVSAAGAVDHDSLVELVEKCLAIKTSSPLRQKTLSVGTKKTSILVREKDVSQVSLIMARRSIDLNHRDQHTVAILNLLLGGGMASRLNQSVREKYGLCYSVYSFLDMLLGTGALGICLSTEPRQVGKALELVQREVRRIVEGDLTEADLNFARQYAKGSTLLALESPSARMQHLGKSQLYYGKPRSLDEIVSRIDAVDMDTACRVAREQFDEPSQENGWTLSAVVPEDFKLSWPKA